MNPTCLQMEPQLKARYSGYLAEYLHSGFKGKPWSVPYYLMVARLIGEQERLKF